MNNDERVSRLFATAEQSAASDGDAITNANITLRQLRAFLAVAEELSFSRAAERLMVSTPWISETVKELERQLKVTLFLRTTRSVELTDAGRVFSGLLAHVLDDLDDAIRVAQRMTARSGRALTSATSSAPAWNSCHAWSARTWSDGLTSPCAAWSTTSPIPRQGCAITMLTRRSSGRRWAWRESSPWS